MLSSLWMVSSFPSLSKSAAASALVPLSSPYAGSARHPTGPRAVPGQYIRCPAGSRAPSTRSTVSSSSIWPDVSAIPKLVLAPSEDQQSKRQRDHTQDPADRVARVPGGHDGPDHAEQQQDGGFAGRHGNPAAGHQWTTGRAGRLRVRDREPRRAAPSVAVAAQAIHATRAGRDVTGRLAARATHTPAGRSRARRRASRPRASRDRSGRAGAR